jgi:signal recognition particle subunit SRP54
LRDDSRKKVLLVSCDVYRPAAIAQLETLAGQVGVDFFPSSTDQDPVAIALSAVDWARRHYHEIVIVDTAGRLAIDDAMMREIAELHAATRPIETLFVVDAMQGQDAVNTARAFRDALPLTGVVLTKLDGDARGGAALSVKQVTGVPIKFIGTGEHLDNLEEFHPDRMASRILGMGDMLSLVETAQREFDQEKMAEAEERLRKGEFTLDDFRGQLKQFAQPGLMQKMMGMLPGMGQMRELRALRPALQQEFVP